MFLKPVCAFVFRSISDNVWSQMEIYRAFVFFKIFFVFRSLFYSSFFRMCNSNSEHGSEVAAANNQIQINKQEKIIINALLHWMEVTFTVHIELKCKMWKKSCLFFSTHFDTRMDTWMCECAWACLVNDRADMSSSFYSFRIHSKMFTFASSLLDAKVQQ